MNRLYKEHLKINQDISTIITYESYFCEYTTFDRCAIDETIRFSTIFNTSWHLDDWFLKCVVQL